MNYLHSSLMERLVTGHNITPSTWKSILRITILSICNKPLTTCRLHKALVSRSIYLYIETNLPLSSPTVGEAQVHDHNKKTVQSLSEDKHHSSQVKHYLMEFESAHEYFLIISTWIKIYNNKCLPRIVTGSFYLCIKLFSDYITCKPDT